jgi:beta-aspartyl-dipeptidase (metallo-type)
LVTYAANTLIRNGLVYGPDKRGARDLWVTGGRIAAIEAELPPLPSEYPHDEIDLSGLFIIPGLIDAHVHLTGGGGEAGPGSRVPAVALTHLSTAGVTSCVGVLGTDGTTRTVRDLVAQTLAMRAAGLSAWCYTGSYQYPPPTLTGSIRDDIVFIDPIIGVGELAISDHRSSQLTLEEFLRVASDCYAAGLMSGKAGILHLHLGDGPREFQLIEQALEQAELPARVYHPTHVNRQRSLFDAATRLVTKGVTVDITAFPEADDGLLASEAIDRWLTEKRPIEKITCSSDGGGCLPVFDADGELLSMDVGRSEVLIQTIGELLRMGHPLEAFLPIFTSNVASVLRLPHKGRLRAGGDADWVAMDAEGAIQYVMAGGEWLVREGKAVRQGTFENYLEVTT